MRSEGFFMMLFLYFSIPKPSWEAPSQLFSPSALSLLPFSSPLDISTESPFFLLLANIWLCSTKRTPFTLLSPPATFASSTNPSQDSSKPQSQSRYRSAILKHILPSSNYPIFFTLHSSALKQLQRLFVAPKHTSSLARQSPTSFPQQWWSTALSPLVAAEMTTGSRNFGFGPLLSGFASTFFLFSSSGPSETGRISFSPFAQSTLRWTLDLLILFYTNTPHLLVICFTFGNSGNTSAYWDLLKHSYISPLDYLE